MIFCGHEIEGRIPPALPRPVTRRRRPRAGGSAAVIRRPVEGTISGSSNWDGVVEMNESIDDFYGAEALARVRGDNGLASRPPTVAYRDTDYLTFEYDRWLSRTWLFVGRAHELPNPGDAKPVPGHAYFLIRNGDGAINCFHNVCRHRGHELIAGPCHNKDTVVCPYHAWTYDLDGRLIVAPHFGGHRKHTADGFDPAEYGLVPVRCAQWHDWLFINIDGAAGPLADFVAPLAAKFADVDFGRLDHYLTIDVGRIPANWKVCVENTMEPYHVPVVHKESAAGQPLALHYMVADGPVMGCAIDIEGSDYTNAPGDNALDNLDMSARYLLRAPNFFLTSYAPDKMIDTMIVPDARDPAVCWLQNAWYTTSGATLSEAEVEQWRVLEERVAAEDIGVMAAVQQGMASPVADDGGVLSPAYESCLTAFYANMLEALER